jgi:hypothetical protein
MKTFRTIIIIVGILVAGAAFNTTFAQDLNDNQEETLFAYRAKDAKIKHKDHSDKAHRHALKSELKAYKYESRADRKSEMKADFKGGKHKMKAHKGEHKAGLKRNKSFKHKKACRDASEPKFHGGLE